MLLLVTFFATSLLSAQLEEQEISLSEQTAAVEAVEEGVSAEEWSFLFGDEEDEVLAQAEDEE